MGASSYHPIDEEAAGGAPSAAAAGPAAVAAAETRERRRRVATALLAVVLVAAVAGAIAAVALRGGGGGGGGGGGNGPPEPVLEECDEPDGVSLDAMSWLASSVPGGRQPRARDTARSSVAFLHVSDLHLDEHYATRCAHAAAWPLGAMGCDAPAALLDSAFAQMARVAADEDAAFAVLSGDFVAHDVPAGTALGTIRAATARAAAALPASLPVIPLLGNNDLGSDYCLPYGATPWLAEVADAWAGWLAPFDAATNATATFREGGYYAAVPYPGVRVLALNTVLYSTKHRAVGCGGGAAAAAAVGDGGLPADPNGQLAWLRAQLDEARRDGQRVLLAGHIPPGNNAFDGRPLWHGEYVSALFRATAGYDDIVDAQLYGHLHRDDFRASGNCSAALLTGSVTPFYDNHPSFRLLRAVANATTGAYAGLADYTQWVRPLYEPASGGANGWRASYSFADAYGEPPTAAGIRRLRGRLLADPNLGAAYMTRRTAGFVPAAGKYLCAAFATDTVTAYDECVSSLPP